MQAQIPPKLDAANAAFSAGRIDEAVDLIAAALEEQPGLPIKVYRVLLANLLRLGRTEEGLAWAERALAAAPDDIEAHNFNGIFLHIKGRPEEAISAFDRVLSGQPDHRGALVNKGHVLNELRDGPGAESVFRTLLTLDPESSQLHRSLGKALWTQTRYEPARDSFERALALAPDSVDAWLDRSALDADKGDPEAALTILDAAITAMPGEPRLHEAKAVMLRRAGLTDRLGPYLESLAGRFAQTGWYQHELGQFTARFDRQGANDYFRRAIALTPDEPQYRMSLAVNLGHTRTGNVGEHLDEAHALLSALPIETQRKWSRIALEAYLLCADQTAADALGSLETLGREWAATDHHSGLLFLFPRAKTPEDRHELVHQHRLWGTRAQARADLNPIRRPAGRRSSSKIRIGFMSSDLREHVVTHFAWPLFDHADRDRFEIHCYSWYRTPEPSPLQRRIADMVDVFRWHPFIGDRDAAQMIADDQLDIVFELGGSTAMNKIEVMAWKPAPISVSWLGYPHSTGLESIDHLLVDPFLNPTDPTLLIEKPLIMPRSWIAMSELTFPEDHVVNPVAPVRRTGHISFGSANSPIRYTSEVLRTWARILSRVPGSRFIFVRPESGSRQFQRNVLAHFAAEGVSSDRVEFRPVWGVHMPHLNDIDISLDSFPQTGGGGTNCEALFMGVPTVTLVGEALFERLSYSILQNAGLGDLCATTIDQYVDIAVALAADTDRLQALRTGLREQLRASPLGQTRQFAEDFYDLAARRVAEAN